jgi:hypothetical protein
MATPKLVRDLRRAERDGGKIFTSALAALQHKDDRIAALVRANKRLASQLDSETPDGVSLSECGRKDLEDAVAGGDTLHLQVVMDSIFGAA